MEPMPTELLVNDARATRAKAQSSRLHSARVRARTRMTIERAHVTVDSSCRLVLERSSAMLASDAAGEAQDWPPLRLVR